MNVTKSVPSVKRINVDTKPGNKPIKIQMNENPFKISQKLQEVEMPEGYLDILPDIIRMEKQLLAITAAARRRGTRMRIFRHYIDTLRHKQKPTNWNETTKRWFFTDGAPR